MPDFVTRLARKGIGGHTRPNVGFSAEWETPPDILTALGPFDDDPASPGAHDGLERPWVGFVWLNPPYSAAMWPWFSKLAAHRNGIGILFARTETRGFFAEIWGKADALLFLKGRPHFYQHGRRASGNSGGPIVLVGYGNEAGSRLAACGLHGTLVQSWTLIS